MSKSLCLALAFAYSTLIHAAPPEQHTTWKDYGGGSDQSKFVALDQITKANVGQLEVSWTYPSHDDRAYQFNPIIVDNVMYVLAKDSSLVAIDITTGEEIWIHAHLLGISRRGVAYWENEDRSDRRLLFTMKNTLQAIDARTGESITSFGEGGIVNLRENLGRDPDSLYWAMSQTPGRVFENRIILGSTTGESYFSTPGHIRAFNVITGEMEWIFHTIPQPGEFGYDTWPEDAYRYAGGANAWGEISLDEERGIAYIPLGSPTYDFYGADRVGSNLFGNCLLALDARTGKRLWHFQTVHHDLWDYDLVSAPQLITVEHEGKPIDAVAAASKQGFLFVLDRVTGEPLWPIEERPVPPSDVPGEVAWPTQPFPSKPPPYSRQIMTEDDITPILITDEERAEWRERVAAARKGLYLPPSTKETVAVPGAVGGTNWGNSAANPAKGIVYLLNQDFPSFYKLELRPPERHNNRSTEEPDAAAIERGQVAYRAQCVACHGEDLSGSGAGPSLLTLGGRISFDRMYRAVVYGIGRMPAVGHLDDGTLSDLHAFLSTHTSAEAAAQAEPELPEGPVVQSGGAKSDKDLNPKVQYNRAGKDYPEGIDAPENRYYTDYGLGHPYLMTPPWSTILAFDLNTGTIKWRQPLGQDLHASLAGASGTGVPRGSQRNGMIVTETGIIFSTAKDGKVYAFDEDDGSVLWSGQLPMGTEGIPAMYEWEGRQYLVVCATTPLTWGVNSRESGIGSTEPRGVGGYVVFALPEN